MKGNKNLENTAYYKVFSALMDWIDNEHPDGNTLWDIAEITNWGLASRTGWKLPVVVDYGLDESTAKTDYAPDPLAMCFVTDDDDD